MVSVSGFGGPLKGELLVANVEMLATTPSSATPSFPCTLPPLLYPLLNFPLGPCRG